MTTIVHTTDLVHDDHVAFGHGLALARAWKAELVSLHANPRGQVSGKMPNAEELLAAWGLPPGAVQYQRQVHSCCDEPIDTLLDGLQSLDPALVVVASHQHSGLARRVMGSGAETLAHNITAPVLLLPVDAQGFVGDDGRLTLTRILVPIADPAAAAVAIAAARDFAARSGLDTLEFVLLHIGAPVEVDATALEGRPGWSVRREDIERGSPEQIIAAASEAASLVVMATRAHDSLADVLLGSHTDRVLRRAHCPLLSVRV